MSLFRTSFIGLFLLATTACSSGPGEGTNPQETLNLARAAWACTGITTYSFTMLRSCLCTGGTQIARVDVVDGVITSLTDEPTGTPVSAPSDTLDRKSVV